MNNRLPLVVVAMALVLGVGGSIARAQDLVTADVPFKFIAAGKAHDPGKYEIRLADDQMTCSLVPPKGAASVLTVVTRLAAPTQPMAEGRIVFDKTGDAYVLSEVWLSGEDGFVTHVTKEKHAHHVIRLQKQAK